jgi:DNA-binding transcriptional ArsR family regulator
VPATDTLAALADPTRRRVFEMLAARPSPVGRLADALPVSRPAVSQHLRVLLDAGLVVAEQRGTERVYQVDRSGLAQVRGWLEAMWDRSLDAFEEAAREEHAMRLAHAITTPVTKTRTVPLPPIAAFELFTRRMGEWWPVATHSIAGEEVATLRFEERVGGRLVEVGNDGSEHSWGEVLAWDPPNRFVISWHPTPTPTAASVLEVRFHAAADGGTRLELEHRGWEEFGAEATDLRDRYEPGWDSVLRHFEESASSAPARSP